MINTPMI